MWWEDVCKLVSMKGHCVYLCVCVCRYLTPDPTVLLSELSTTTSKKYNKLNSAIATLVSDTHTHTHTIPFLIHSLDRRLQSGTVPATGHLTGGLYGRGTTLHWQHHSVWRGLGHQSTESRLWQSLHWNMQSWSLAIIQSHHPLCQLPSNALLHVACVHKPYSFSVPLPYYIPLY